MNQDNKETQRNGEKMKSAFGWFGWLMAAIVAIIMVGCCGNCKAADTPLKEQAVAAGKVLLEQASEIAKSNAIEATSAAFKELTSTNGTNATMLSQAKDMTAAAKEKGSAMAGKAKDFAKEAASKFGENTQGWGHEIGQALKDAGVTLLGTADGALTITQDHLLQFANSGVGKFTMFAIGWKLFGSEIMHLTVGGTLLLFLSLAIWRTARRITSGTMVVTSQKGWWIFSMKTKEFHKSVTSNDDKIGTFIVACIAQALLIWICVAGIMF